MPTQRFQFPGTNGQMLAAALDLPAGEPSAFALLAHCFTCGKDVLAAKRIAEGLTKRGIAVLRFDFTGIGASEGEFANSNFSSNIADLVQAADYLRTSHRAPAILIGHSLGGAAILAAATQIPEAKAVVTIAAPSDPGHVTGLFRDKIEDIRREVRGSAQLDHGCRDTHEIRNLFLRGDDVDDDRLEEFRRLTRHAQVTADDLIDEQLLEAAAQPDLPFRYDTIPREGADGVRPKVLDGG